MRALGLGAVFRSHGRSVTATNDTNGTIGDSSGEGVEGSLGALGKLVDLEDAGRAVPQNGLGVTDSSLVQLDGLGADIKTQPAIRDAILVVGGLGLGVRTELVGDDVVDGQRDLDIVLLGLLYELTHDLGALLVEERVANLDTLKRLLESERHAAGDDEAVDLVEQVVDQLDLVRHLGAAQNSEEGALGVLEGLREVIQLLLHEETGGLLR